MEAICSSGLSSLSLPLSLCFPLYTPPTNKHTHKLTCLEREVKESTFQMPGLLGHGDEHTLAGHPGTAGCGRVGLRDLEEALLWPGCLHKQLPNQICRPNVLCSSGHLRPALKQGSDCLLLEERERKVKFHLNEPAALHLQIVTNFMSHRFFLAKSQGLLLP